MPAPTPGDIEVSAGLTQWGAEIESGMSLTEDEIHDALLELARPLPATAKSKAAMCETLATAARLHDLPVGFFETGRELRPEVEHDEQNRASCVARAAFAGDDRLWR